MANFRNAQLHAAFKRGFVLDGRKDSPKISAGTEKRNTQAEQENLAKMQFAFDEICEEFEPMKWYEVNFEINVSNEERLYKRPDADEQSSDVGNEQPIAKRLTKRRTSRPAKVIKAVLTGVKSNFEINEKMVAALQATDEKNELLFSS
uniref:DRBM domain-containing protein n=1 Tax=Ascaris lumbricoides TaxID=6252 RepID=A0A0M3I1N2_ASCLU